MNNDIENQQGQLYIVGSRGYSAYEVAVQNGFVGTEEEWLESLKGETGEPGTPFGDLTPEQKEELRGEEGKSAYEVAVDNGYQGTEEDWVNDFLTPDGYYNKDEVDEKINFFALDDIKVHYINSGTNKGDCIVIETNDKNMIIDFGEITTGLPVINYLVNNNITKIDYALVTHYHGDHIGGISGVGLLNIVNSGRIDFSNCLFLLPNELDSSKYHGSCSEYNNSRTAIINGLSNKGISYREPVEDEIIELDVNAKVRLINCYDETNWDIYYDTTFHANGGTDNGVTELNNFSVVAELKHGQNIFLFTGDIEPVGQERIVDKIYTCDVYKIEHHGANDTTNDIYLEKITPKVAINMNREASNYNNRTLQYLRSLNIPIYTTNDSGNIVVTSDKYNIYTNSENDPYYENIEMAQYFKGQNVIGYQNLYCVTQPLIEQNDDLNDYIIPGTYRCPNNTYTTTIINRPSMPGTSGGFTLEVRQLSNPNIIMQIIYDTTEFGNIHHRLRRITGYDEQENVVTEWTEWNRIEYPGSKYLGKNISSNDDLNDYVNPGKYISSYSGITNSLSNCPLSGTGFKLEVEYISGDNIIRQTIKVNNATSDTYIRTYWNNAWQSWYKVNMTEVIV